MPEPATLAEGDPDVCGELLGEVRSHRDDLLPAPSAVIEEWFTAWVVEVEALGLDCVDDADVLEDRLATIDELEDRIDIATGAGPR